MRVATGSQISVQRVEKTITRVSRQQGENPGEQREKSKHR